jgi:hypothetical protein
MPTTFFPATFHVGRRRFVGLVGAWIVTVVVDFEGAARADEPLPEFRVITHPDNPHRSVSRRFLADAFLKDVTRWEGGEPLHPVDLRSDSATRSSFSERVVKRSVAAVRSYWQQRIFSGRGLPPPELNSDEDVVRFVNRDRGAVGYVSGRANIGKARQLVVDYD